MKKYSFLLFLFASIFLHAQDNIYFKQLRAYTAKQPANKFDSLQKNLTNHLGPELHYLYPLYQGLSWEERFKKTIGEKNFYETFSQWISFAGDYEMTMADAEKS